MICYLFVFIMKRICQVKVPFTASTKINIKRLWRRYNVPRYERTRFFRQSIMATKIPRIQYNLIKFAISNEERQEQMKCNLWASFYCKKYVFIFTWSKLNWRQKYRNNPLWLNYVAGKIAWVMLLFNWLVLFTQKWNGCS